MTDEEMAKEWVRTNSGYSTKEFHGQKAIEAFLAGLKAGREIEKEYVRNNAFTSMNEQGLFPFAKWHNLKKNSKDLPDACMNIINQDGEKVRYDYVNKVWRTDDANDCNCDTPIAWCEVPTFEE